MAPNGGCKILGGTELEMMQFLWECGRGSVRDVVEA
jgi:hypothetical protein